MKRPAWAAAPRFAACWGRTEMCAAAADDDVAHQLRAVLRAMSRARVLAVGAAQVEALPSILPYSTTADYLREVSVPFPHIFLDMDGAGLGDLVDDTFPGADGALVLSPGTLQISDIGPNQNTCVVPFVGGIPAPMVTVGDSPGLAIYDSAMLTAAAEGNTIPQAGIVDMRGIAADMTERAVAVLSWLESANVEVIETPLRPKAREREIRKGRKIALTVHVKPPKSRRKYDPSQNHRDFSHRFERRGHYKHFSEDTQLGASDPTKLSFVPGRGFVRKIWCPPHVVGPECKPLVPKVRILSEVS